MPADFKSKRHAPRIPTDSQLQMDNPHDPAMRSLSPYPSSTSVLHHHPLTPMLPMRLPGALRETSMFSVHPSLHRPARVNRLAKVDPNNLAKADPNNLAKADPRRHPDPVDHPRRPVACRQTRLPPPRADQCSYVGCAP